MAAVAASALLFQAAVAVAQGAPANGAPGDLRLPARYSPTPPEILGAFGTADGTVGYALPKQASGMPAAAFIVPADRSHPLRLPGVSPFGAAGHFVLLGTPGASDAPVQMFDTATGTVRSIQADTTHAPRTATVSGGWVGIDQDGSGIYLALHDPGGATLATVRTGNEWPSQVHGDDKGVVWQRTEGGSGVVMYAAWEQSTGAVVTSATGLLTPTLTPSSVVYATGNSSGGPRHVVRRRRSDLTVISDTVVSGQVIGIVATDSAIAWTSVPGAMSSSAEVWTNSTSSSAAVRAAGGLPTGYQEPFLAGSDFGVIAGTTSRTRGLYAVSPGATGLGPALALVGPTAPFGLSAGPGRVVFEDPATYYSRYQQVEQGIDITSSGPVVRGSERTLSTGASYPRAELSGGSIAAEYAAGPQTDVVVFDHTLETFRIRTTGGLAAFSGNRIVLAERATDGSPRSRVINIASSDSPTITFAGASDLDGSVLATLSSDGAVDLHNLDTGQTSNIRPAGAGPDGTVPNAVQLGDGLVAWSWTSQQGLARTEVQAVLADPRTTGATPLTLDVPHEQLHLAGGRVSWIALASRDVHLLDPVAGSDDIVGTETGQEPGRGLLGLGPDFVAWVDDDNQTVVHQLPEPASQPQLVSTAAPQAFSVRTGLLIRGEADQALSNVTLTVSDASKAVVAQTTSAAPDGGLRPRWDGRLTDGTPAPAGTYAWKLTTGSALADLRQNPDAPTSGTAVLDNTPPSLSFTAPVTASDSSTNAAFRLNWNSADTSATFDVTVTKRGRQPDGTIAFGPPRLWRRAVPAGTAVYGADAPYSNTPGSLMRFVATARDAAGNTTSSTQEVLIPYDDGANPQRYSPGWTRITSPAAYGGTSRTATSPASLTLRASTNRILVIGDRCHTCGRFSVSVDGHLLRTADSYGTGHRQRLLDLRLPGSPALHTIQVRNLSTIGRPRLNIDAIGLVA